MAHTWFARPEKDPQPFSSFCLSQLPPASALACWPGGGAGEGCGVALKRGAPAAGLAAPVKGLSWEEEEVLRRSILGHIRQLDLSLLGPALQRVTCCLLLESLFTLPLLLQHGRLLCPASAQPLHLPQLHLVFLTLNSKETVL